MTNSYKINRSKNQIVIENVSDFNLEHIFDCGQCFRWEKEEDGSFTGVAYEKALNINFVETEKIDGPIPTNIGNIIIENLDENEPMETWINYLDLDTDYYQIKKILSKKDPVIKEAIKYGQGIRILNQQPWETLISFIISQNNNIPRIKGCIEKLSQHFGENLGEYKGKLRYAFPRAEVLGNLTLEDLEPIKLGYRAKYILETSKAVVELGDRAYDEICILKGVGPKVESCINLFGLGKRDAFPIDVWIRRVMNQLYNIDENDVKGMKEFAQNSFGENGGIAQQYLFYYMRQK